MDSSVPLTPLLLRCAPLSASVSRRIPPPQRGCHPQPKRPSIRLESSPGVPTSGFEELKPSSPSHRNQEGNFSFSRIDLREVVDKCGVEPKEGPTPHLHGKPEKPLQGQRGTLVTQRREQGHRRDDLVGGSAVIVPIPSGAEKTLVLPMNDWVDFPPSNVGPDENEWTCTPSTASSSAGSRAAQEDQVEDEVTKPSQSFSSLNGHRHNAPSCDGGEGLSLAAQLDAVNAGDTRPVEQWLDSVCRSASSRGEALLAAQVAKFVVTKAEHKASAEGRWFMQADLSELQPSDRLLRQAVHRGNHPLAARAVQFLVDRKGANVNHRDCWQRTPLHSAAAVGLVDLIRFFLRRGAELDALDQDLRTPLHFACAAGHVAAVQRLTRPDVGARTDIRDIQGFLPGEFFLEDTLPHRKEEVIYILTNAGWEGGERGEGGQLETPRARRHSEAPAMSSASAGLNRSTLARRSSSRKGGLTLLPWKMGGGSSGREGQGAAGNRGCSKSWLLR